MKNNGKKEEVRKKASLRIEVLNQISTLAAAAFGLVAALAWNAAIQDLFKMLFPGGSEGVVAKFSYAVIVTVLVVIISTQLGRLSNRYKEEHEEAQK